MSNDINHCGTAPFGELVVRRPHQNLGLGSTPQFSRAGLRTQLELLEQERIHVPIAEERPLAEAIDALEDSKRGAAGKIVLMC